jgi:hypothetical protein
MMEGHSLKLGTTGAGVGATDVGVCVGVGVGATDVGVCVGVGVGAIGVGVGEGVGKMEGGVLLLMFVAICDKSGFSEGGS